MQLPLVLCLVQRCRCMNRSHMVANPTARYARCRRRRLPKLVSLQSEIGDDPWAAIGDD